MGAFTEYGKYDALGLAELVKKRKVSALELCEEAISRIERLNPALNAVIRAMYEQARKAARGPLPKGPFAGVPFLLKDALQAIAGEPLTNGCRAWKNYTPEHDSEYVKRIKNAGLIILGKTNVPEFSLLGYTEPDLFGPARNPWNTERTTGGSSGGSAAAVAARMVPMAGANDGGGSIRIPSGYCGLFGLKPTRGRNPLGPYFGEGWQGAVVEHALTLSVRDSAAFLDATCGADAGAPYIIPPPAAPYSQEIKKAPGKLRVAFSTRSIIDSAVHPECVRAVEETVKLLENLGHRVVNAEPEIDGRAVAISYLMMYFVAVAGGIEMTKALTGKRARRSGFEPTTWTLGLLGRTFSAGDFVREKRVWNDVSRSFGRFFQNYNLYLTPTTAFPAHKIGELQPKPAEKVLMKMVNALGLGRLLKASGMVEQIAMDSLSQVPFTQLANFSGLPAMTVPLYWTHEGLPCGSHFMARFGDEATLFRLAAQLEKARPWFNRVPGVVG